MIRGVLLALLLGACEPYAPRPDLDLAPDMDQPADLSDMAPVDLAQCRVAVCAYIVKHDMIVWTDCPDC